MSKNYISRVLNKTIFILLALMLCVGASDLLACPTSNQLNNSLTANYTGGGQVILNWSTDGEWTFPHDRKWQRVYRSTDNNNFVQISSDNIGINTSSYTDTSALVNGTTYSYYVIQQCRIQPFGPTNNNQYRTVHITHPNGCNPIRSLTNVFEGTSIRLNWTEPMSSERNVASGNLTGYKVYRKIGLNGSYAQVGSTLSTSTTTYLDSNVSEGTQYYYWVKAVYQNNNETHTSTTSDTIGPIVLPTNTQPRNLASLSRINGRDIVLEWSAPISTTNLTGYAIYEGTTLLANKTTSQRTHSLSNVTLGNHTYEVRAIYSTGTYGSASLLITVPLNSPATRTATADGNSVILNWSQPATQTNPPRYITGYRIHRGTTLLTSTPITARTYTDTNRPNGTYTYSITTIYNIGESQAVTTNSVQINPQIVITPTPPTALQFSSTPIGSTSDMQFVTIANTGSPFSVTHFLLEGDYPESDFIWTLPTDTDFPFIIRQHEPLSIGVQFSPQSGVGIKQENIKIYTNISTGHYLTIPIVGQAIIVPEIAVTSTGLNNLKVNQAVSNASIIYTLSNTTYAASITASNFAISGLPAGLTAGSAQRTSNTVVTVNITGTPTTHNPNPVTIILPASIPASNVVNATSPITPTGTVSASAVDKGTGAVVSGVPVASTVTHNSITVNAVTIPTNPGSQTVEYAINTSTTAPSTGWQSSTTFSGLNSNTSYRVFARSASNTNYDAGQHQVSASITTLSPPSISVTSTGLNNLKVNQEVSGASIIYTLSNSTYATNINASHFTVSGLPAGLSVGATYRSSNTVVTVNITGTPTTHNTNTVNITLPANIPSSNVVNATNPIIPTGSVTVGAIAKGDGAAVSGAPQVNNVTHGSISVHPVTIPTNPGGQTVEYAISRSTTAPTTGWQNETLFTGLISNDTYYVFARSRENNNYLAGTAQRSSAISTTVNDTDETIIPFETTLLGNYPNPFNPETTIKYSLLQNDYVDIEVYSVKGQLIKSLVNKEMNAGHHQVVWNGQDNNGNAVSSGIYFYRMRAGDYQAIKKMILMK